MKVSVITVCYNAQESIEKTLNSIIKQDFIDYEFVVVDGKSTDKTNDIINNYKQSFVKRGIKVVHISEKDNGIYDAMNKGVKLSSGDWICFMNSGDEFADSHVLKNVFSEAAEEYGVIYGNVISRLDNLTRVDKAKELDYLYKGMAFCHQSSFVKRKLMLNNPFDLSYKICADYNLFLGLYMMGVKFKKLDFSFSVFDTEGVSNSNIVLHYKEKYQIQHKYKLINCNSIKVKFIISKLIIKQFIKRILPKFVLKHIQKTNFIAR